MEQKSVLVAVLLTLITIFISCKPTANYNQEKTPDIEESDSYDKKIGNGMMTYYIFHNFIGQEPDIISSKAEADTERYLEEAITYLNNQFDYYINQISNSCELVMNDIIKNMANDEEEEAFILCYRVLANEAYKEGLGNFRNDDGNVMMKKTLSHLCG